MNVGDFGQAMSNLLSQPEESEEREDAGGKTKAVAQLFPSSNGGSCWQ